MQTSGERQNFQWRPNDNSATTRVKYDLEAEHWLRSFKSAEMSQKNSSFSSDLNGIGLVFGLIINLFNITIMLITMFLTWIFKTASKNKETYVEVKQDKRLTNDELRSKIDNNELKIVNIYED
tara:strand:- start:6065 stop:6433 length:369 start_codon:yes stop_codon:yes gene_type:complete